MIEKLSERPPKVQTKLMVMFQVSSEHNVNWQPKAFEDEIQKPEDDHTVTFQHYVYANSSNLQVPVFNNS